MQKEIVLYPEARELKNLGFDEPCFGYYVDGELRGIDLGMEELGGVKPYYQRFGFHVLNNHDIDNPSKVVVTAPTYSQAFRWFREEHLLEGLVLPQDRSVPDPLPLYFIVVESYENGIWSELFNSTAPSTLLHYCEHEEAELACLKKLIEIVKEKQ
jgi:hypothetical protein